MSASSQPPVSVVVEQLNQSMAAFLASPTNPAASEYIPALLEQLLVLGEAGVGRKETAHSLLSFFHNAKGIPLGPGDRDQVRLMWNNLRSGVLENATPLLTTAPTLITPIAGSGPVAGSRGVLLMVESRAIRTMLEAALEDSGFIPATLDSMQALATMPTEALPVAIIADLSLCRDDPETCSILATVRQRSMGPVHLFCLSSAYDFTARLDAVRLGATRFLKKPVDVDKLLAVLNGVTARSPAEPFRILFVDDDKALTKLYSAALVEAGCITQDCNNALLAPEAVAVFRPDVIVTDVYMPGCNGLELAALLRQDEDLSDTPILFLSSEADIHRQMAALDLGGDDFLTKPVPLDVLTAAVLARAKRARMLKRIRRELQHAHNQAEQASIAKSRFMADMNHELKVPLNAILGYSQLMAMELGMPGEAPVQKDSLTQSIDCIRAAGEHQLQLINEILELSRAEGGHLELIMQDVNVAVLLSDCLSLLQPQVDARHLQYQSEVPASLLVRADAVRLKQVLLNLLSNAIKYNREGGALTVLSQVDGGDVRIVVRDDGIGIPPNLLGNLFQPFSRLHANHQRNVEGTGLGLALIKSLVEAMGGRVGVSSREGVGSEFWFSLATTRD